jgi:hypothetical protein
MEIAALGGGGRLLLVRCTAEDASYVRGLVTGISGSPQITQVPAEEDPAALFRTPGTARAQLRLGLAHPPALPLRAFEEFIQGDPILPLFGALSSLAPGEGELAQLVLTGPAPATWATRYKRELLAIKRRTGAPEIPRALLKGFLILAGAGLVSLYLSLGDWLGSAWMLLAAGASLALAATGALAGSGIQWSAVSEEAVTRKVTQTGYHVEIRLSAAAVSKERASRLVEELFGAYQVYGFEGGNHLVRETLLPAFDPADLASCPEATMLLGDEEIAGLWHLPAGGMPDRLTATRVRDTLPDPALLAPPGGQGWRLGRMGKAAGGVFPVTLPLSAITHTHVLLVGKTRTGKTTGLLNAVRQIAGERNRALVVIDPHDDLVRDLLGLLPPERAGDVIYLNFTDPEWIPASRRK